MKGGGPNLRVIDQRSPSRLLAAVNMMLRILVRAHAINLSHSDSFGDPMAKHQQKAEKKEWVGGSMYNTYGVYLRQKDHFAKNIWMLTSSCRVPRHVYSVAVLSVFIAYNQTCDINSDKRLVRGIVIDWVTDPLTCPNYLGKRMNSLRLPLNSYFHLLYL